jgi:hypothetical protein
MDEQPCDPLSVDLLRILVSLLNVDSGKVELTLEGHTDSVKGRGVLARR